MPEPSDKDIDNMTDEEFRAFLDEKAKEFREHVVPDYAKEFTDEDILAFSDIAATMAVICENIELSDAPCCECPETEMKSGCECECHD